MWLTKLKNSDEKLILYCSIFVLIFSRIIASLIIPVYDDAYITYRYAENLSNGLGLIYNSGENVLGLTTPIWGLVTAFFSFIGLKLPNSALILNIILDGLLLFLTQKTIFKKQNNAFLLFAIFYSISPMISRITIGGMEMNLFLIGILSAIYFYNQDKKVISIVIASISYFIRPEAVFLVLALILIEFISGKKANAFYFGLLSLAIVTPFLIIIYNYYGSFIPQSISSKWGLEKGPMLTSFLDLIGKDILANTLFPLALLGAFQKIKENNLVRIYSIFALIFIVIYTLLRVKIWSWYPAPIIYLQFVLSAFGLSFFINKYSNFKIVQIIGKYQFVLMFVPLVIWGGLKYHYKQDSVTANIYKPLTDYFQDIKDKEKLSIFANDIGIIGFASNSYIFDAEGLVSPSRKNYKIYSDMIENNNYNYLFLNVNLVNIDLMTNKFNSRYFPIKRFAKSGDTTLFPDRQSLNNAWSQDYILYKRKI